MSEASQRVTVADPAGMRRGARRAIRAGIIVLVLLCGFTVGGIAMLRAGELPGLPFAAGGATAQLAVLLIVFASVRVRATLTGDTIASRSLVSSRRIIQATGWLLLVVTAGLGVYAVIRAALGDPWTLLTAAIIAFILIALYIGTRRLKSGTDTLIQ